MNKENCTKGPVYAFKHEIRKDNELGDTIAKAVPHPAFGDDEREANAELIAEAFSVLHETGMTPRELVAMVARLRNSIRHAAHCRAPQAFHCTCDANALWDDTKTLSKYQPVTPA